MPYWMEPHGGEPGHAEEITSLLVVSENGWMGGCYSFVVLLLFFCEHF